MTSKKLFLTFEGTEGAGKSTLIRVLADELEKRGHKVRLTREPGGTPLAESIRSIILHHAMNPWTELFLYEASRAEHVAKVIRPALDAGEIVLCDRFTDSSLAYQSAARGLPWKTIDLLNGIAVQKCKPDLTVWLDIDPELGLRSARDPNRFEAEGVAFQAQVRKGFAKAYSTNKKRWLKLGARSGTPQELAAKILKHLEKTKKLAAQK